MKISRADLFRIFMERFPTENKEDLKRYFDTIIDLLIDRLVRNSPIVIDNFGVFSRKRFPPKRICNIQTKKYENIVSERAYLRVSENFLSYFKDPDYRKLFLLSLIRKSKQALIDYKNKRGTILI